MKKSILIAGVALVLALTGLWFYGRPAYKRFKETRFIEQASKAMAKGDYRLASLSARQAWQLNPRNLEACRLLAEMAEASRSPSVLDWRRRAADIAPTIENKLLVAGAALGVQAPPYPLAAQTLEDLRDSAKNVTAYHVVSAELAMRLNHVSEAAAQFEEASRLEPSNELHQVNLSVLRLQSTNASLAAQAQAALERLSASTNVGAVALRWLVAERLRQGDLPGAERFSSELLGNPQAAIEDRLQHLTILQRAKRQEADAFLSALQNQAATNAAQIYQVSAWMIAHGQADRVLAWLAKCPSRTKGEMPAPLAFVDGYVAEKDWAGLETFLQGQQWGEREYLRLALLSRAASEQNHELSAAAQWRAAVREAGDRLGPLTALLKMAGSWAPQKAREDLLWLIAERFPRERWALQELERLYVGSGNTRGLNKLSATIVSNDPRNFIERKNVAATALLLKINLVQAHEIAKEVYAEHPEDPSIAATYAYSLYLQGRIKDGLAALERLQPKAFENPAVVLYYGVLLAGDGQTNKAVAQLKMARQPDLLPEEKALLDAALATVE